MREVIITCQQDATKKLDEAPAEALEFYRRQWKPRRPCTFIYPDRDALAFIEEGHNLGYFQDLKRAGLTFSFDKADGHPWIIYRVAHNLMHAPTDAQQEFFRRWGLDREGYRFFASDVLPQIYRESAAAGLEIAGNDSFAGTTVFVGQFTPTNDIYPAAD